MCKQYITIITVKTYTAFTNETLHCHKAVYPSKALLGNSITYFVLIGPSNSMPYQNPPYQSSNPEQPRTFHYNRGLSGCKIPRRIPPRPKLMQHTLRLALGCSAPPNHKLSPRARRIYEGKFAASMSRYVSVRRQSLRLNKRYTPRPSRRVNKRYTPPDHQSKMSD